MSYLAFIARILQITLLHPSAVDVYTKVAAYAVRQSTAAVVRAVRNQTASLRNSPQTFK